MLQKQLWCQTQALDGPNMYTIVSLDVMSVEEVSKFFTAFSRILLSVVAGAGDIRLKRENDDDA